MFFSHPVLTWREKGYEEETPLKIPAHLKRMNPICAVEAGEPLNISHLAGANPIPQSVWHKQRDASVFIGKGMGAHGVEKLQLGDAIG